jgi:putative transposase
MDRLVLSDAAWERMAPLIIGRPDQKGSPAATIECSWKACCGSVRTGSPWRDFPEAFGDWNSVFRRFSRWSIKGVWWRIFEAMSDDPDFESSIPPSSGRISTPLGRKKMLWGKRRDSCKIVASINLIDGAPNAETPRQQ